jgi:hypothetical protein
MKNPRPVPQIRRAISPLLTPTMPKITMIWDRIQIIVILSGSGKGWPFSAQRAKGCLASGNR